jgi:hypothetical protein
MAFYDWEVTYDASNLDIVLDNVQNIVVTKGRVQVQDPFKAGTATVSGRDLASLPAIDIGGTILIEASRGVNTFELFNGVVADVQITYGQVPAMDTWTIHCEDALALMGRTVTLSFSWGAGLTTGEAARFTIFNGTNGAVGMFPVVGGGASTVSAQTVNEQNVLQVVNQLMATEQGVIYSLAPNEVQFVGRDEIASGTSVGDFSDGSLVTVNPTALFSDVVFRSQADSFFTRVLVEPEGLAAVDSGTGDRRYTMKTYDETVGQAGNLASYVLSTLQVQQSVPSTISAISEVQVNDVAMNAAIESERGGQAGLILRGDSYNVFLNGCTVTATPEQTRFTYNLVSSDALNFFILDSTAFGRLDFDKLGF